MGVVARLFRAIRPGKRRRVSEALERFGAAAIGMAAALHALGAACDEAAASHEVT